jgi:hypothetical protein
MGKIAENCDHNIDPWTQQLLYLSEENKMTHCDLNGTRDLLNSAKNCDPNIRPRLNFQDDGDDEHHDADAVQLIRQRIGFSVRRIFYSCLEFSSEAFFRP